ncbi:MAG: hypothetical protein M3Y74_21050 [Chloroflexota bacterium]|nr:hypothetical protein [Chloroflexota bacterium]
MTTKTSFKIETDAFAFDNSWPIDGRELNEIRRYLAHEHAAAVRALANSGLAHRIVRAIHERHLIDEWMRDEHVTKYGLCGGMAYAALDYYRQGWVIPQGTGPHDHPTNDGAAGGLLRNYIWRRLLDSMQSRAAGTMLAWSLALHLIPRLGPAWVLAQSKKEWAPLKERLDAGEPWPIGLVGMAHGSFANHQVLALGYDDPGDGTGTIYVYDSTCPAHVHTLALDFRGRSVTIDESCARGRADTRWKGFFRDAYTPARPPIAVGLSGGMTVALAPGARAGDAETLRYTARNYSFSRCPALALRIGGQSADHGGADHRGGEEKPLPLDAGAGRTLVQALQHDGAAGVERYSARCYLGLVDGVDVWKDIPAHAPEVTTL